MKKTLLSAVAFLAAMSVNAQEVCSFDSEALGLNSDGVALTAGTVLGQTESIICTVGADDTYKPQSVQATVGGQEISGGLQGSSNPKDADGGTPSGTLVAPVSGAYLQFEAKANGFLYVIHKASSNKAYTVFEEGEAIGYTYAAIGDAETDLGAVYQYTLEGAGEFNYLKDAGLTKVEWAEQEYLKSIGKYDTHVTTNDDGTTGWANIAKGGIGVIKFAVYEGCKYIVNANGSKITAGGFFFDTTGDAAVVSGDVTILSGEGGNQEPAFDASNLIPNFTYCWNDAESLALADGVLTFNAASWGGAAAWLDGKDLSAYNYFVVEFAEATPCAVQPFIQYASGAETKNYTNAGATIVVTALEAGKEAVNQIAIQAAEATTLKIAKIYLSVDDPTAVKPGGDGEETVLWEGEAVSTGWANQPGLLSDGGAELTAAGAAVGDVIRFYCTAPDDSWQCELTEGHWGGIIYRWAPKDQGPEADGSPRVYEIVDISKGYIDVVITEDMLTKATTQQWWGNVFLLNGDGGLTVTKLTLVKGGSTGIQAAKAQKAQNGIIYNIAGQKVDASYKGIVIKNGKKYMQK